MQHLQHHRYQGSELGRRLYGAAAVLAPTISLENLQLVVTLSHAALLADSGLDKVNDDISGLVPSAAVLKDLVELGATDSMFSAVEEITTSKAKVFLICDKGAGGKVANAHFVKLLTWFSPIERRVKIFNVDTDEADG